MPLMPVSKDFVVKNGLVVRGDTVVTSSTNQVDALQVNSGAAIAKNLIVGSTATIYGPISTINSLTVGPEISGTVIPAIYSNNVILSSYTSEIISTSTSTTIFLDQFDLSRYRTARYTVQVVDTPKIHVTEVVLFHNGSDAYKNEYGISTNNGLLGTFDAIITGTDVVLTFSTNSATSMTVKVVRLGISV